jgi:ABC-type nitrate/sulfonate/bicarbonate transport system substrate-binding protein
LDEFFDNDKYDINFEITSFANGPAEVEAFAAGELDFAVMGSMPATTGASSDYGFKLVAIADKTEHVAALVALADSGITSIADLKGKKFGTIFGGTNHYYAGRFLESAGLTYDDVEFINSGNETPSSLRAGELDAGVIGLNVAVELEQEGTAVLLADTIEGIIGFSEVCVSDEIIEQYDGLASILLKGYDNLYQYIDKNKEDYVAYLGELTGVETDSVLEVWDVQERRVRSLEDEEIYENAEELLQWMQEQDMVTNTDVKLDDIIDYSVAKEAGY